MTTAVPLLNLFYVYQAQVSLVDQCRGLQCLARFFVGYFRDSKFAQLLIDQWQKLVGDGWIARFNLSEDLRDVGHDNEYTQFASENP